VNADGKDGVESLFKEKSGLLLFKSSRVSSAQASCGEKKAEAEVMCKTHIVCPDEINAIHFNYEDDLLAMQKHVVCPMCQKDRL
jgi:hypothetical protein